MEGSKDTMDIRDDIAQLRKELAEMNVTVVTGVEKIDNAIGWIKKLDEKVAIQNGRVYRNEADIGLVKRDYDYIKNNFGAHLSDVKDYENYRDKKEASKTSRDHDWKKFWYGVAVGLVMFVLSKIQWNNIF